MIRGTFTRMGRITLWIVFWPLGLWRSIVHSRRKADNRMLRDFRRMRG
jgi:hypothetical protein